MIRRLPWMLLLWAAMLLPALQCATAFAQDVGGRVDAFTLLDQTGRRVAVAPSRQNTFIYFYRGDW
ncbi:MAG: hypothetical protein O7C61_08935 [SAR324 cluster bacterium]|nr:hypothetical protein [SAR324 cluster bacterium]